MIALALLGGYIITSFILFKYPHIIHSKKGLKFKCRHISHRGGAGENLENTISAFNWAVKQGTDMLEVDLQLTKDKKVVVFHDSNLFRATGINKNISELEYKELPRLKEALPVDFDEGRLSVASDDTHIPLLEEVFQLFPDITINIDIKSNNDELIQEVSRLIKKYNREKLSVWGNVSSTVTNKCYKENPDVPIFFCARRVVILLLLAYTGLLPFVPIRESCLELMMPAAAWENPKLRKAICEHISYRLFLWLMERLLLRKALFEHLEKRGIQTYIWVLNKEEHFEKAFSLGATGVMTDYPSKLRAYLDKHPSLSSQRNPLKG